MRSILASTLVFCLAIGLPSISAPAAAAEPDQTHRIEVGDRLAIRVAEEESLDIEQLVGRNGTLELPLLGEFNLAGLTSIEAEAAIGRALEESYLQRATVTVRVLDYRSRTVSITGAVETPGSVGYAEGLTLLDALNQAGGLAANHGETVHIVRRAKNGLSDRLEISVEELLMLGSASANIPLAPEDEIHFSASRAITVFFIGEIQQPGTQEFQSNDHVTVLTAIAQAGGLTDRASNKIIVKRLQEDGTRSEILVGYKGLLSGQEKDFELEDRDLILVKESFF